MDAFPRFDGPGDKGGGSQDKPPLRAPFDDDGDDGATRPDGEAAEEGVDPAEEALARRRARLGESGRKAPEKKKSRSLAWLGWLLLIALVGAVIGGGYKARRELVAIYPPMAVLYEKLGMPVEPAEWLGLELHNLKSATVLDAGVTKIEVAGEVVNVSNSTRAIPPIRVAMRGTDGRELAAYTLTLEDEKVGGEGKVTFTVRLPAPKDEVADLEVAFSPAPR